MALELASTPVASAAASGMRMHATLSRSAARRRLGASLGLALATCAVLLGSPVAHAGEWVQVSCINPNGTAAGSQGWVAMIAGAGYGSNTDTNCGPGAPAVALLSADVAVPVGSAETLDYIPPPGSTLVGGSVDVALLADGRGYGASGTAVAYSPEYAYNGSNVFFQCASGLTPCAPGSYDFAGVLELPQGRGGELYLSAGCGGQSDAGRLCNEGGSEGAWSMVRLYWAQLALSNSSTPAGTGFGGTLLAANSRGISDLIFTASDPEGPGVYGVAVQVDGATLYDGTPDENGGACAPAGTSGASLMFDATQPCKRTETLDLPIDTTVLPDGTHTLKVTVTDAAKNSSVVYDGRISTQNAEPSTAAPNVVSLGTPNGRGASEHAQIVLHGPARVARRYGERALTLHGVLTDAQGAAIAGATLEVLGGAAAGGQQTLLSHATTGADGTFAANVPPGPSRRILIAYRAFTAAPGYSAQTALTETVIGKVTLRVTPQRTRPGGTIILSGRVAGPLPRRGVVVELLVHYRGAWEPFRDPRTSASGRFSVRYHFEGAVGRFPFRAEVLGEQSGFPYATGLSRVVDVQSA